MFLFLFRFDKNELSQLVSKTCPNRIQERLFMQVIPLSGYLCFHSKQTIGIFSQIKDLNTQF